MPIPPGVDDNTVGRPLRHPAETSAPGMSEETR